MSVCEASSGAAAKPTPWVTAGFIAGQNGIDDTVCTLALGYLVNAQIIAEGGTLPTTPRDAAVLLTVLMAIERPVDAVAYAVAYADLKRPTDGRNVYDVLSHTLTTIKKFVESGQRDSVDRLLIPAGFEVRRSIEHPGAVIGSATGALEFEESGYGIGFHTFGVAGPFMSVSAHVGRNALIGLGVHLGSPFDAISAPQKSPLIEQLFGCK